MSTVDDRVLAGTLLWARNHIEVSRMGVDADLQRRVVARLDAVLVTFDPPLEVSDLRAFLDRFPEP